MILKVILCLYLHLYFWGSTKVLIPHLQAKALVPKFIPRGLAPNCPMKNFYQVQDSKKRADKRVGKGRQKHIGNILGDWEGIRFQEMQGLIQSNLDSCGMKILPYGGHLRNSSSGIHIERTGHPPKGDPHRHQQQSMQPISRLQLLGGGVGIHPIKPNPTDNKLYGITYNLLAKLRVFHKTRTWSAGCTYMEAN